jgi:hypothetical protein
MMMVSLSDGTMPPHHHQPRRSHQPGHAALDTMSAPPEHQCLARMEDPKIIEGGANLSAAALRLHLFAIAIQLP